jgi:hypothetical protein
VIVAADACWAVDVAGGDTAWPTGRSPDGVGHDGRRARRRQRHPRLPSCPILRLAAGRAWRRQRDGPWKVRRDVHRNGRPPGLFRVGRPLWLPMRLAVGPATWRIAICKVATPARFWDVARGGLMAESKVWRGLASARPCRRRRALCRTCKYTGDGRWPCLWPIGSPQRALSGQRFRHLARGAGLGPAAYRPPAAPSVVHRPPRPVRLPGRCPPQLGGLRHFVGTRAPATTRHAPQPGRGTRSARSFSRCLSDHGHAVG